MQKKNVSKITKENILSWYKPKIRACAYIRVSTGHDKQLDSLENQPQYYERMLQENPDYIDQGTYTDAGISGAKACRWASFLATTKSMGNWWSMKKML